MDTLETRLGSLDISGLNIDAISKRYMCQYTGSLVGRHFKTLAQLMIFACYDLVDSNLLEVWLLLGRLTTLLWFTEIDNLDIYIAEIQIIVDEFLVSAARCSPSIIVLKPKFHYLVHLPMYIKRFGPAVLFSTERFKSFHGVFRAGGYWREGSLWVRASSSVLNFMTKHNEFRTLLGLPDVNKSAQVCSITLLPRRSLPPLKPKPWSEFILNSRSFAASSPGPASSRFFGIPVLLQTLDSVKIGSNILFQTTKFGQVGGLFGCALSNGTTHTMRQSSVIRSAQKHSIFDMPVLDKNSGDVLSVPVQDIVCVINLQHNCAAEGKCTQRQVAERQEREDTNRTQDVVKHTNNQRYILNTQGLHGIKHVRRALPLTLLEWRGLQINRGVVIREAVQKLASASANKALQARLAK
ncbi:hypothetical protein RHS01_10718 [Rhizoctonia solani]|uniref:Uncharacterized protein n=1 Tax=Rhizoctonia solani TaxID=456999 RepID=A0A8H7I1Q3_9AGAM|nr:hypothetical protein RHS01_10718 [Rhizoctonia solani]